MTAANAIAATTPVIDLRLRSESVDQDGLPENAHAVTLRGRLGAESGEAWGFKLLGEVELVWPLDDEYNDTLNGQTQYPVVPIRKPTTQQAPAQQLVAPRNDPGLGRQRITYDDQRFVGNVGWRQNEQTYDALRITNKSLRS